MPHPTLKWFDHSQLPAHLAEVSASFALLARWVDGNLQDGQEKSVALRKLLEGKDAAVRQRSEDYQATQDAELTLPS